MHPKTCPIIVNKYIIFSNVYSTKRFPFDLTLSCIVSLNLTISGNRMNTNADKNIRASISVAQDRIKSMKIATSMKNFIVNLF